MSQSSIKLESSAAIRPGVVPCEGLHYLISKGAIEGTALVKKDVGPSAFDLHLTNRAWKVGGGIKGRSNIDYSQVIHSQEFGFEKIDISRAFLLEPKNTYVIELEERLSLKNYPNIVGIATGKSSIGRLDVLTRLICDRSELYDSVPSYNDHKCDELHLYVEVSPITFGILVKSGVSLNQLRLFIGDPSYSRIGSSHLQYFGNLLLDRDGNPINDVVKLERLSVNLTPDPKIGKNAVAFHAKSKVKDPIDLTSSKLKPDPKKYWDTEKLKGNESLYDGVLEIKPNHFYIIRSNERLHLPADIAVYCQAMSESLGEIRVHYAGFAHPHFGNRVGGTPLIFEVRGHNVTTYLRHDEVLARLEYYRMSLPTGPDSSKYEEQELKLSSKFEDWN